MDGKDVKAETTAEVLHKEEADAKEDVESEEEEDAEEHPTKDIAKEEDAEAEVKDAATHEDEEDDEEEVEMKDEAKEEEEAPRRTRPKRKAAEKSALVTKKTKKEREEKPKKSGTSGFSKPVKVSEELADFLGQDEISRPQLTKFMWAYFKENGLQDPCDRRLIIADEKLKELLKVDRFKAFGFMKLVKPHLIG